MNEVEILEELLKSVNEISYSNQSNFDLTKKRTDMYIRKFFGNESHYLSDFKKIQYHPIIYTTNTDSKKPFEYGLKQLSNLIATMIEDKKHSSNYLAPIKEELLKNNENKLETITTKIVRVLIATPSDVNFEREQLIEKLETKFRRDGHEERCGARLIVQGWEELPSQSGYPQDIINNDLVKNSNIILAVFRHKLGTPTINPETGEIRNVSGTAEELIYAISNEKSQSRPLAMAYFYSVAPVVSLESIEFKNIEEEWNKLKEFRKELELKILYKKYNDPNDILNIVCIDLCENIIKLFNNK